MMNNDDKLIAKLFSIYEGGCYSNKCDLREKSKEIIKLVRESEWISVETELPDDMDMTLTVYYENDAAESVSNCDVYLKHLGFCVKHRNEFKPIVGVTHWKPRSSPPKK